MNRRRSPARESREEVSIARCFPAPPRGEPRLSQVGLGGSWTSLPLDSTLIQSSARTYTTLPETVFLRSADCLHLVTALHHGFSDIHTYGLRQADAAVALEHKPRKRQWGKVRNPVLFLWTPRRRTLGRAAYPASQW